MLKDLQELQLKADNYFSEAQKDKSEHGAGYFFLARKIDKIIGSVTGTRKNKKMTMSLIGLRAKMLEIASEYGAKTGITYGIDLEVKIDEFGSIYYSAEIKGLKKEENADRYSSFGRIYSKKSFTILETEFRETFEKDVALRSKTPEDPIDITVE